ncbi:DUF975 family protein [Lachnospiraceae bacterium 45-W7]
MKRTSAELKRISREQLNGHWGFAIGVNLLMQLIVSAVLMPFYFLFVFSRWGIVQFNIYMLAVVIIAAVSIVMQCGVSRIYLCFARKQEASLGMMFGEFGRRPDRYILGYLMVFGLGVLCMLPGAICLVIGIVSGLVLASGIGVFLYLGGMVPAFMIVFRLSLAFYLLVDHADLGVMEAFRQSSELMQGNKGRLFYMYLSFIGWFLLGILSCGLGMLWVMPYMMQTFVNFYREAIGEMDEEPQLGQQNM